MIVDLFDLNINGKKININGEVNIPSELLKGCSIRRLDNVCFRGYIDNVIDDNYELCGTLSGSMILPDGITLEDYKHDFTSEIDEKIDENRINLQKSIDITLDLWQNILVEVPLRAVNPKNENISLSGDGWRLISEEEVKTENNPFMDLLGKE